MMRNAQLPACVAALLLSACATEGGSLNIRPVQTGFAEGTQSSSFRVNEARAHFALGNVALAAEGFRRALREEPASVDALNGLAACYDRMGRFDLSRSYYEKALALAPDDARLYANLALSLLLQSRREEATAIRREMASRFSNSATVALASPNPIPLAIGESTAAPPNQASMSVPLEQQQLKPVVTARAEPVAARPATRAETRLERVGLGEVALRTGAAPSWRPLQSAAPAKSALRRAMPPQQALAIIVLNGTARSGLAAQARSRLQTRGWGQIVVGNTAEPLRASQILHTPARAAEARRLSRLLGVPTRQRNWTRDRLIIQLGSDRVGLQEPA